MTRCHHCTEPLLPHERVEHGYHIECMARIVLGSVGHQLQRCHCYGGTEEDPPGMSVREAAKAAYDLGLRIHVVRKEAYRN